MYYQKYLKYLDKSKYIINGSGKSGEKSEGIMSFLSFENINEEELNFELLNDIQCIKLNIDDFDIKESIGTGTFGSVNNAVNKKTNNICVIKTISINNNSQLEKAKKEINIFCSLNNENIIKCQGYDYKNNIDDGNKVYIFMEKTNIKTDINFNDLDTIKHYTKQFVEVLSYLHSKNIVHFDIKESNILFTSDNKIKLIDFGESVKVNDFSGELSGTEMYMAPEIKLNTINNNYLAMSDIWSLGIMLVNLYLKNIKRILLETETIYEKKILNKSEFRYTKYQIFKTLIFYYIYAKNVHQPISSDTFFMISSIDFMKILKNKNENLYKFCDFLNKCLQIDYKKRFNAENLKKHDFLV